jgi:O-antigen ligase
VITVLPFLALYVWKGNYWQRILAVVAAPFIINMLILCNSRGATIGVLVALSAGMVIMKWPLRLKAVALVLVALPFAISLVDQKFIDRQFTLVQYAEEGPAGPTVLYDGASSDRILSWQGAVKLIGDRPLGVGGGGYDLLSPIYAPQVVEAHEGELRAVHNTYLWAGSDWGIPGGIAFIGFIVSGLLSLHRIRRETANERMVLETLALEVGLFAFLGAAMFVNRLYAEILYWLVGLSAALTNIHDQERAGAHGSLPSNAPARAA